MQSRFKHAPLAAKELGKNLLMGIGSIRSRRLQGHRTSTFADAAQLHQTGVRSIAWSDAHKRIVPAILFFQTLVRQRYCSVSWAYSGRNAQKRGNFGNWCWAI